MAFIEVKNLSKVYKMGEVTIKAVENISFQIEEGEFISILDARNDNVYFAIYKMKKGFFSIYKNPEVMQLSDAITYIDNLKLPIYFLGDIAGVSNDANIQNNVKKDLSNEDKALRKGIDIARIEQLYLARASVEKANSEDVNKHEYLRLPYLHQLQVVQYCLNIHVC